MLISSTKTYGVALVLEALKVEGRDELVDGEAPDDPGGLVRGRHRGVPEPSALHLRAQLLDEEALARARPAIDVEAPSVIEHLKHCLLYTSPSPRD